MLRLNLGDLHYGSEKDPQAVRPFPVGQKVKPQTEFKLSTKIANFM